MPQLTAPSPTSTSAVPTSIAPKRQSKKMFWLILSGIAAVVVLVVVAIVVKGRSEKAVVVTTEKAVVKTITQIVSATGKVQPEIEVKIQPEVTGEIIQLPFREGAPVKKGDLLVSIKPDNYKFGVEQAQASLVQAKASATDNKAQLAKAEADFKRSQDLYAKHLISDSDFVTATTAYGSAQANYQSALANIQRAEGFLSQAQDSLTKTVIYSPIDGTVSSRSNEVGERVAGTGSFGGAEVMRVADLSNMEVRVNINENDIVNVKVNDKAKVTIDAFPNRKFEATVKEIGSAAKVTGQGTQDEVTNFTVKIRILDKDVPLRPGMSANADVETKVVENVVAVPIQSVTVRTKDNAKTVDQLATDREKKKGETKGEGAATAVNAAQQKQADKADRDNLQRVVFVRNGDTVKMVKVETGIQDTSVIEIKSGLKGGDEVVSGSFGVITRTLKDGMRVKVDQTKNEGEKK
jgi:HlyD family secretion protein